MIDRDDYISNDLYPIYSIGHSNVSSSRIIELIKPYNIEVLVDVRSSPYSQYAPQFNREVLESTLKFDGLGYHYAGDSLGGRPKNASCYKNHIIPEEHADYLHLVDYPAVMEKLFFQKGIQQLLELASQKCIVVMCSEEDPGVCHRHHMIGKYLKQHGITLLHIRKDGKVVKDHHLPNLQEIIPMEQPSLF